MIKHLLHSFLFTYAGIGGVFASSNWFSALIKRTKSIDDINALKNKSSVSEVSNLNNSDEVELSLEEVAAITAAIIKKIYSTNVVVRKIRFLNDYPNSNWVNIGRTDIMSSHHFQRKIK